MIWSELELSFYLRSRILFVEQIQFHKYQKEPRLGLELIIYCVLKISETRNREKFTFIEQVFR